MLFRSIEHERFGIGDVIKVEGTGENSKLTITKVKRGKIFQQAPLLYDLTALQKDCNIHYDLPVDKTLSLIHIYPAETRT